MVVTLTDAELGELDEFITDKKEGYKTWLEKKNKKNVDHSAYLKNSLSNINVPGKLEVKKEPAALPYPLEFASDQLLNNWLDKTLKNIESGSKPLAILEAITGLALLEGKLMSLVMTVLDGVLTDDDLKNMTVYGIKSFATTRFAKLFFDDFGEMMPVMEKIGDPMEVLKIVDKLRHAMGNPDEKEEEKSGEVTEVTDAEMQQMLQKWYNGAPQIKKMLTDYLVNTFKFVAPAETPQGDVVTAEGPSISVSEQQAATSANVIEKAPSAAPSAAPPAAPPEEESEAPSEEESEEKSEAPPEEPPAAPPAAPPEEPPVENRAAPPKVDTKIIPKLDGGTRRHAAPSQAVTRKRWFEVTLRDVLSGTQ